MSSDDNLLDGQVPADWWPWRDPDNPFVTLLPPDKDALTTRRDT